MSGQQVRAKLKRAGKSTGKCLKKAAWQACKVCLVVTCAPCICIAVLHNRLRRRRRNCNLGVSFEHARPPVPYPRERALTIPSTEWQEDQKTLDQPQSLFMTKLPLEVRRLVYEHAIGKQSIHLWNLGGNLRANPRRLGECRCGNNDSPTEKQLCFALPLLRTCRLIYSEAIEFLYSSNTFCMATYTEEILTIDYLSHYFLPQRLGMIRSLYIRLEIDNDSFYALSRTPPEYDQIDNTWDSLSKLTGLRTLHITLGYRYWYYEDFYQDKWIWIGEPFWQPVKRLTAPTDFTIVLPHWKCSTDIDVGDTRCVLQLPERPQESSDSGEDA